MALIRASAVRSYMEIEPQKRQGVEEVVFSLPFLLEENLKIRYLSEAADAIQNFRFPSEEMLNMPEAQEAAENYRAVVVPASDKLTEVHLCLTEEAFEQCLDRVEKDMEAQWEQITKYCVIGNIDLSKN